MPEEEEVASKYTTIESTHRRVVLERSMAGLVAFLSYPTVVHAAVDDKLPDRFNVDDYLKTGMVMNPMGVSGQAGMSTSLVLVSARKCMCFEFFSHVFVFNVQERANL